MENIQGIYKQHQYRRSFWLFTSGFLGFLLYAFPSVLKILLFLIPIIVLCYALSGTRNKFNWLLFLGILVVIMLLSSLFMTNAMYLMSGADPPTDITYPELDINVDFNTVSIYNAIDTVAAPILFFLIWFVPVLAIAGAIWALIIGQVNEALTAIVRVTLMVAVLVMFVLIFDAFGYSIPLVTDAIKAVADWYITAMKNLYNWMQGLSDPKSTSTLFGGRTLTPPGTPGNPNYTDGDVAPDGSIVGDTNGDGIVDWWESFTYNLGAGMSVGTMDAFNKATKKHSTDFQCYLVSSVPMVISGINIVFGLLFMSKRIRNANDQFFDRIKIKTKEPEIQAFKFNYNLGALGIIVVGVGWFMFLYYKKIYSSSESFNIFDALKLIWYTMMIGFSIFLIPQGIYKQGTWKNTAIGTIIGFGVLYISFNFLYGTTKTLDAYNGEYNGYLWYQVVNTFLYVAPAESLFFHILLPSYFLGWMYKRSQNNLNKGIALSTNDKKLRLDAEITFFEDFKTMYPKGTKNLRQITKKIAELKRKQQRLEYRLIFEKDTFVFEQFNLYVLFYIFIIVVNVFFSLTHWVIISDRTDFFIFWLSGLGIIYLISGTIISIISWRFGWCAGLLVHATYNISQIIIATYIFGVVM